MKTDTQRRLVNYLTVAGLSLLPLLVWQHLLSIRSERESRYSSLISLIHKVGQHPGIPAVGNEQDPRDDRNLPSTYAGLVKSFEDYADAFQEGANQNGSLFSPTRVVLCTRGPGLVVAYSRPPAAGAALGCPAGAEREYSEEFKSDHVMFSVIGPRSEINQGKELLTFYCQYPGTGTSSLLEFELKVAATSFSPYLLNFLIIFAALLTIWRSYIVSRDSLAAFLLLSFLMLATAYGILAGNAMLRNLWTMGYGNEERLIAILSFLPSGSALILASHAIGSLSQVPRAKLWWASCLTETGVAALAVFKVSQIPWSLFAFFSLTVFGLSVGRLRAKYSEIPAAAITFHPRYIAVSCALAYVFWGTSQLILPIIESRPPLVSEAFAHLASSIPGLEVLYSRAGLFIILLYVKAMALYLTVLLVWSREAIQFRRSVVGSSRPAVIALSADGRIRKSDNVPSGAPLAIGEKFFDFVGDPQDKKELKLRYSKRQPIERLLCRLPALFGNRIVRVGCDYINDGEQDIAARLYVDLVEENFIARRLDRQFLRRQLKEIKELEWLVKARGSDGDSQRRSGLSASRRTAKLTGRLRARAEKYLSKLGKPIDLGENRVQENVVWGHLKDRLKKLAASRGFEFVASDGGAGDGNIILRIGKRAFFDVAESLEQAIGELDREARIRKLSLARSLEGRMLRITVTWEARNESPDLVTVFHAIKGAGRRVTSLPEWGGDLGEAMALLEVFGAEMNVVSPDNPGSAKIFLDFPYYSGKRSQRLEP